MKILPLHQQHLKQGARFSGRGEWETPEHYGDPVAEHRRVRQDAGLADQSFRGKLLFRGKDRADFLQGMITNDVAHLKPGQGCYAALTTAKARMLSDCRLYCLEDSFLMDLEPEVVSKIQKHLDFYILSSDVVIEDWTDRWGLISVYGPKSAAVLSRVLGLASLPPAEYASENIRYRSFEIRVARSEITGEEGYDFFIPAEGVETAFGELIDAGIGCIGQQAVNTLRIEAGIPRYGVDMDESHFPMEAGLTKRAVSETKGCYIGQETVARALAQGHMNRYLTGLEVSGDIVPSRGDAIRSGDKPIGSVTSAVLSPTLKKVIAMGYVHREFAEPGTEVAVARGGHSLPAVIVRLPFYRRSR